MDIGDQIDQLLEEFEKQRGQATAMQEKMNNISQSASSPQREVTVTVGHGGILVNIAFPTGAYKRLTPTALVTAIMQAYNEAKEKAYDAAADIIAPALPDGMDARALVRGKGNVDDLPPAETDLPPAIREALTLGPWR
jgi:DNA-binding protein YbaB